MDRRVDIVSSEETVLHFLLRKAKILSFAQYLRQNTSLQKILPEGKFITRYDSVLKKISFFRGIESLPQPLL